MLTTNLGSQRGNFVLLRAGTLRLLVPREEVGAAGYLDPRPVAGGQPGLMQSPDGDDARNFLALSPRMGLHLQCPADRFIGAPFAADAGTVWCWNELRVLIDALVQWQALPAVLRAPGSPLSLFTVLDDAPVFACSADALVTRALAVGVDHAA